MGGAVPKILVVEDNPDQRRILSTILYYNGFDPIEAATGRDAVNAASEVSPDLILMDLKLPDMTGFLAAEIIQSGMGNKRVPVICVTGLDITPAKAKQRGCVDLLLKPVLPEDLIRAVHRVLSAPPAA